MGKSTLQTPALQFQCGESPDYNARSVLQNAMYGKIGSLLISVDMQELSQAFRRDFVPRESRCMSGTFIPVNQ